jgi:hypothetical protein
MNASEQLAARATCACVSPARLRRATKLSAAFAVVVVAMIRRVPPSEPAEQDRFEQFSVPLPGWSLIDAIDAGERAGRPVWHLPGVTAPARPEDEREYAEQAAAHGWPSSDSVEAVHYRHMALPKLTWTHEHHRNQLCMPLVTEPETRRVRPELYLLLLQPNAAAWSLVDRDPTASKQLGYLIAAAYRDVRGWPLSDRANSRNVADLLGYSSPDAADRAVQRGRALWAAVSAWPWWALGVHVDKIVHAPPVGWQTLPRVADSFFLWRDPPAYRARERARQRRHAA